MQLLDAVLAFALTLAALAMIVTIIMEAGLRTARMRKKNLVEVARRLNKELDKGPLKLTPQQRWQFIEGMIENPALATVDLAQKLGGKKDGDGGNAVPATTGETQFDDCLKKLGTDKATRTGAIGWFRRFCIFLKQAFWGDHKRASLYTNVSTEHVLRRLAETDVVQTLSREASWVATAELNRLARKYEEFGSAVSASFKRHSQMWSIGVAVAFAILANVDGLRIFETYRADADLAKAVIEQQESFIGNFDAATKRQEELDTAVATAEERRRTAVELRKNANLEDATQADSVEADKAEQAAGQAEAALAALTSLDQIKRTAEHAQQQVADLVALGVPIGWQLYPNCPFGGTREEWAAAGPQCRAISTYANAECAWLDDLKGDWSGQVYAFFVREAPRAVHCNSMLARVLKTVQVDTSGFLRWLFATIVTGLLIGLGAPFWFDVAKRLSMIRGVSRQFGSGETRHAGADAEGDSRKRTEIVRSVVRDAAAGGRIASAEVRTGTSNAS